MSTREEPDGAADRSPRAEAPAADAGRADDAAAAHETSPAPAVASSAATGAVEPSTEATAEPVAEPDVADPTTPAPSAETDEAGGSPSSDDGHDEATAPGDANVPDDDHGPEVDEPDDPMTAEEIAVDRSRVRRAPRYGRFIGIGVALGLLVSLAQTVGAEPEDIAAASGPWTSTTVGFFLVMATIFVPVGVLLGAMTALVLDRRSRRPRRKGR